MKFKKGDFVIVLPEGTKGEVLCGPDEKGKYLVSVFRKYMYVLLWVHKSKLKKWSLSDKEKIGAENGF